MFTVMSVSQPEGTSVTLTVYAPSHRPVAALVFWPPPGAGAHWNVYGPAIPDAATEAVPLQPPAHEAGVAVTATLIAGGCVIVKVTVVSQPLASAIRTLWFPAQSPVTLGVPCPTGGGVQVMVNPPVPPVGAT